MNVGAVREFFLANGNLSSARFDFRSGGFDYPRVLFLSHP